MAVNEEDRGAGGGIDTGSRPVACFSITDVELSGFATTALTAL